MLKIVNTVRCEHTHTPIQAIADSARGTEDRGRSKWGEAILVNVICYEAWLPLIYDRRVNIMCLETRSGLTATALRVALRGQMGGEGPARRVWPV